MMKIIIFGAGKGAKNTIRLIDAEGSQQIECIADNNSSLWGSTLLGYSIVNPIDINKMHYDMLLIASQYHKQIKPQLLKISIPEDKITIAHNNMMQGVSLNDRIFDFLPSKGAPDYTPYVSFRLEVFHTLSKYVEQIIASKAHGSIAEFGCGTGQSSYVIAKTIRDCSEYYNTNAKHLYLFDSFEGLPQSSHDIDLDSPLVKENVWIEGACLDITAERLSQALKVELGFNQFSIYKGWFSDTLVELKQDCKLSLIHLDCDLYESSYQVLSYIFKNRIVTNGAIILFDDWSCNGNIEDYGQQKAWSDISEELSIKYSSRGFYGLGSHVISIERY